jgi:hypothetical protein
VALPTDVLDIIDGLGFSKDMARLLLMAADRLYGAEKAAIAFAADQILSNIEQTEDDLQAIIEALRKEEREQGATIPMAEAA